MSWLIHAGLAAVASLTLATADAGAADPRPNLARGGVATASSVESSVVDSSCGDGSCTAAKAIDGDLEQRWASAMTEPQWWQVDLGQERRIDAVEILWERAYATRYRIETSGDGATFTEVADRVIDLDSAQRAAVFDSRRLQDRVEFAARSARFVRITGISRATPWGFSIWEVGVFGPEDPPAGGGGDDGGDDGGGGGGDGGDGGGSGGGPGAEGSVPPDGAPRFDVTSPPSAPAPPPIRRSLVPLSPRPVVRIKGYLTGRGAVVQLLSVRAPRGTKIRTRCRGKDCPDKVRVRRGVRRARLAELERSLRAGTVIEIFITKGGTWGHYTRFKIRGLRPPTRTEGCVRPKAKRAASCPVVGG